MCNELTERKMRIRGQKGHSANTGQKRGAAKQKTILLSKLNMLTLVNIGHYKH